MSEADRIRREQELMEAMKGQMDPNQPVQLPPMTPATRYNSLIADGVPKEQAQQDVFEWMKTENMRQYSQSGIDDGLMPMEGEF